MEPGIIVALLGFSGTCVGSLGGILATSKLTNFRLQQLEEKVDKHNTIIERTYKLEQEYIDIKEDIDELKKRER